MCVHGPSKGPDDVDEARCAFYENPANLVPSGPPRRRLTPEQRAERERTRRDFAILGDYLCVMIHGHIWERVGHLSDITSAFAVGDLTQDIEDERERCEACETPLHSLKCCLFCQEWRDD